MIEKLFLFRHGLTSYNLSHAYCGITDAPLCQQGIDDLKQKHLSLRYPSIDGCTIITSGMRRTEQTLSVLYPEHYGQRISDPRFCEMNFGIFEKKTYQELKDTEPYQKWINGNNEKNVCPEGESGALFRQRVLEAFAEVCTKYKYIALFTHGGVIAVIMDYLFTGEKKNRYEWQGDFGCGYEIDFSNDKKSYKKIPENVRGSL